MEYWTSVKEGHFGIFYFFALMIEAKLPRALKMKILSWKFVGTLLLGMAKNFNVVLVYSFLKKVLKCVSEIFFKGQLCHFLLQKRE